MDYDLVFIGGDFSAQLVSRFLKKRHDDLSIKVLERGHAAQWQPGESTVGIGGMYLIRELGLSTYCYQEHLPKNALRYFFREDRDGEEITDYSEVGTNMLPAVPTFQLDRKRFVEDLWAKNRRIGIDIELNAEVEQCTFHDNEPNEVVYSKDGTTHTLKTSWVINAAGRACGQVPGFADKTDLDETRRHQIAAAWGRYRSPRDIDKLGGDDWRERVGHTSRYLSTNHFMEKGHWIWAIPIGNDVMSFGVVYDQDVCDFDFETRSDLHDFLLDHPFAGTLIEGAEQLDFQSAEHVSFRREQFCGENGWVLLGQAHSFADPFYSQGTDVIARHGYLIEHLLQNDGQRERYVTVLNRYTRFEDRLLRTLFADKYTTFDSYEIFDIKSLWDFYTYTNYLFFNYYNQSYEDFDWIRAQLTRSDDIMQLTEAIQQGIVALYEYLEEHDEHKEKNNHEYSRRQSRFQIEEDILVDYDQERMLLEYLSVGRFTICELLARRFDCPAIMDSGVVQEQLDMETMLEFELSRDWFESLLADIEAQIEQELDGENVELAVESFATQKAANHDSLSGNAARYVSDRLDEPSSNRVQKQIKQRLPGSSPD